MTDRVPYTIPPEISFPEPMANTIDPRLKHRFQPWDGQEADAVLIGVPFDEGVALGGGRPGADKGPTAFRQALIRFGTTYDAEQGIDFNYLRLADAGDLEVVPDNVAATHEHLAGVVALILDAGAVPLVIGGGHDATFGSVKGLMAGAPSVAGINVDAHLDLREVVDGLALSDVEGRITSGTPYRRILEELGLPGQNLVEFGLHGSVNSREHIRYAQKRGVPCLTLGQVREQGIDAAFTDQLRLLAGQAEALFVSVDLDVFAAAYAPGVSAPGAEGLTPEEGRQLALAAGRHPGIRLFELMELNPLFDVDERTSRLAVMLLCAFLAGLATRKAAPSARPKGVWMNEQDIITNEQNKYGCRCDIGTELQRYGRPMHMGAKPAQPPRAAIGTSKTAATWDAEAAKRMLHNNLDPANAIDWEQLIVYGGTGRAARNWHEFHKIVKALDELAPDETLCVQSGRAVYVAKTFPHAPRVIIANSNLVPRWATQEQFNALDRAGLMMYGQMTAGSWIYIGTQGILQGTYQTYLAAAEKHYRAPSLKGRLILTAGMGGMSGAQPMAVTMNEGVILDVEVRPERIERKVKEGFCDRMTADLDKALIWADEARSKGESLSIGLVGNAAEVYPALVRRGVIPDMVSDQTPAHDLGAYVPIGDLDELDELRVNDLAEYHRRSLDSIAEHVEAILEMQRQGAVAFDYGNNLRAQAEKAGVEVRQPDGAYKYPGFVPAYIRPLFCRGLGPFRWAAISGDPQDIHTIDQELLQLFPDNDGLTRWIRLASEKVPFLGLPTRICWLGYGDRARFGQAINTLIADGKVSAPIVIGRDHLDTGSVASPDRETEGMLDGSDAVADWPLLNFALNTASGASWVSFHHGGGVGIGNALHAGMVIVADGTAERAERLERVLTVDPGIGVARHALSGYGDAQATAKDKGIHLP